MNYIHLKRLNICLNVCFLIFAIHFQLVGQLNLPFYDASGQYQLHGENIPDAFLKMETLNENDLESWRKTKMAQSIKYLKEIPTYELVRKKLIQAHNMETTLSQKVGNYMYELSESTTHDFQRYTCETWKNYMQCHSMQKASLYNGIDPIQNYQVSFNNQYAAIEVSVKGSDSRDILFLDLKNGKKMGADKISNLNILDLDFSFCWKDSTGLFYTKEDKLYLHLLATHTDSLIRDEAYYNFFWNEDTHQLIFWVNFPSENDEPSQDFLYIHDFEYPAAPVKKIQILNKELHYCRLLGNIKSDLFFEFQEQDLVPQVFKWDGQTLRLFLPAESKYSEVYLFYNKIVCFSHKQNRTYYDIYDENGTQWGETVELTGEIRNIQGSLTDSFWVYTSYHLFSTDDTLHIINLSTKEHIHKPFPKTDASYIKIRKKYASTEGDSVSMDLFYTKETKKELCKKLQPVLLWVYGGFGMGVSALSSFETDAIRFWLDNGGILAIPYIRGGIDPNTLDDSWWEKGKREHKIRTIEDLLSATEFLIKNNYTSKSQLACMGHSNGAMVIAAAMTKAPQLFKAVVLENGLYDMFRYKKDSGKIYGYSGEDYWLEEYGDAFAKNDSIQAFNDFQAFKKYSPYYKIESWKNYPYTLCMTSNNDNRASPLHSYKFVASLQHHDHNDPEKYFLYLKNGGHESQSFDDVVYKYTFLCHQVGMKINKD